MKYTDDQIFGIFGHKASGIQTYLEAEEAELDWQDEVFEQVRNEIADIIDGVFGPQYKGPRPGKKELMNVIMGAVEGAIAEDENDNSADKSEKNSPAGF